MVLGVFGVADLEVVSGLLLCLLEASISQTFLEIDTRVHAFLLVVSDHLVLS
jgi:hypothetical protein